MSPAPPPSPAFGEPLPISPSAETLRFLATRRSASALSLGGPGPDAHAIRAMLGLAARAPDHGKLNPWRFVILQGAAKQAFVAGLETIAAGRADAAKADAKLGKIRVPPLTIAVLSRHVTGDIPEWEQRLSAGSVCTLLVVAAQAMGFGANWITDWYAYDPDALRILGVGEDERVAGYVQIGTAREAPLERTRPDLTAITTEWTPD